MHGLRGLIPLGSTFENDLCGLLSTVDIDRLLVETCKFCDPPNKLGIGDCDDFTSGSSEFYKFSIELAFISMND